MPLAIPIPAWNHCGPHAQISSGAASGFGSCRGDGSSRTFSTSGSGRRPGSSNATEAPAAQPVGTTSTAEVEPELDDLAGPSTASPFPISGLGADGGSGRRGGRRDEEVSFVQVGRPIRARAPPGSTSAPAPSQRPRDPPPAASFPSFPSSTSFFPSDSGAASGDGAAAADALERIPMVPPGQRQQPPLPAAASRQLWRSAEELAAAGRLVRLGVGRGGLSRALLAQAGELLERHELIRVYLLPNCELEVGFVSWVLEAALDCVALKVKGRTVTLYREHGLPRPPASLRESPEEEAFPRGWGASRSAGATAASAGEADADGDTNGNAGDAGNVHPAAGAEGGSGSGSRDGVGRAGPAEEEGDGDDGRVAADGGAAAAAAGSAAASLIGDAGSWKSRFRRAWAQRSPQQRVRLRV